MVVAFRVRIRSLGMSSEMIIIEGKICPGLKIFSNLMFLLSISFIEMLWKS